MVISKIVRPKKKTLTSVIDVSSRYKKVTIHDKILTILDINKQGLTHTQICDKLFLKNAGAISSNLKFMLKGKVLMSEKCPHCDSSELYKLNI
tara:strand:+ start:264 stop:542 length:279 start_codon:yes stop_codon:yes gene_type:complete